MGSEGSTLVLLPDSTLTYLDLVCTNYIMLKNAEIFQNILLSKRRFWGWNLFELSEGTDKGSSLDPSSATILSRRLVGKELDCN
jgi:hypothetical protein